MDVRASGSSLTIEAKIDGDLWTGEAKRKLSEATAREVRRLAVKGFALIHAKLPNVTGATRAGLEIHQTRQPSLYAVIRMRDKLPARGTGRYASQAPYIIASVWESGRYGGSRGVRVRVNAKRARARSYWQKGAKSRTPHWAFRDAERVLKREAATWREDAITRDWRV